MTPALCWDTKEPSCSLQQAPDAPFFAFVSASCKRRISRGKRAHLRSVRDSPNFSLFGKHRPRTFFLSPSHEPGRHSSESSDDSGLATLPKRGQSWAPRHNTDAITSG
ncbi:hypothetical protein HPB47_006530 [Ixodes persulcatus]|uniref:Uncharacterized protein n=1 Tax=Ixodes persulcatus TaxID=34615 RepID=A0AC60PA45_IXOPE|nr:hypothetical protein HPB47_006530 [Ixodes persulcatus]